MSDINLNEILAQRAEATGIVEGRVPFEFNDKTYTIRDNMTLDDDDQAELDDIVDNGTLSDVAIFWMGETEWEKFEKAGGTASMVGLIAAEKARREQALDSKGNPTRPNRSQRRAAGRKR